jgi:hypothetical protein
MPASQRLCASRAPTATSAATYDRMRAM